MIANHWPGWFREHFGDRWPASYLCVDTETTGFSPKEDLVIEYAHCLVIDGCSTNEYAMLLDWTSCPSVPPSWLEEKLIDFNKNLGLAGTAEEITPQLLREQGVPVSEATKFISEFIASTVSQGIFLAGHQLSFDERMLAATIKLRNPGVVFELPRNGYFDTAAIEKATMAAPAVMLLPQTSDTMASYFNRVLARPLAGLRYKLAADVAPRYGLSLLGSAHRALTDAMLVRELMEKYRGLYSPAEKSGSASAAGVLPVSAVASMPAVQTAPVAATVGRRRRGQRN